MNNLRPQWTKADFRALRQHYRMICKADWQAFRHACKNRDFYCDDVCMYLYNRYWDGLTAFASNVGCTVRQAANMLNLEV